MAKLYLLKAFCDYNLIYCDNDGLKNDGLKKDKPMRHESVDMRRALKGLRDTVSAKIDMLPSATEAEVQEIGDKLLAWEAELGWKGWQKHPGTYLSLLSSFVEDEGWAWKGISFWLGRTIDAVEEKGIPRPCEWAGVRAGEMLGERFS
jgi:hypothetical protein